MSMSELLARTKLLEEHVSIVAANQVKLAEFVRRLYLEDVAPLRRWAAKRGANIEALRKETEQERGAEGERA
jgi:hypothetical protein